MTQQVIIKNPQDRRDMVAILADNGYSVKLGKVKVGNQSKITVDFWKDEEKKEK